MAIEFELKFRAAPEILEKLRNTVPGEERPFAMETTYYDTPTGQLQAKHFTLRRRLENQISVCTLKTPAAEGRNEFEVNAPSMEEALSELCKLSGEELPSHIVPICGAKFTRIAKTVALPDATVELALDRGVLSGGGREAPVCEVEVELKSGTPQAAIQYAAQLSMAFGLEPEKYSKFRRALALAKGE